MSIVRFSATGWVRRFAFVTAFTATALAVCGTVYERFGESNDAERFPRMGRPVQAAGMTFNLNCYGSGSPTVILESGLGLPSLGWVRIQPEIANFARVCSYDRAGYGWSDRAQGHRRSLQLAKELKLLLESARERAPYILVGPSFGGFIIRVYTVFIPPMWVDLSSSTQAMRTSNAELTRSSQQRRSRESRWKRTSKGGNVRA